MKKIKIKYNGYNLFNVPLESFKIKDEVSRITMNSIFPFIDEKPICVVHFYDGYCYLHYIKNSKFQIKKKCIEIYLKQKG